MMFNKPILRRDANEWPSDCNNIWKGGEEKQLLQRMWEVHLLVWEKSSISRW